MTGTWTARRASTRSRRSSTLLGLALGALVGLGACSAVDPDASVDALFPDRTQFDEIAPFVGGSCGTLDCHGSTARPMRVYGRWGLRLDPGDVPDGEPTTAGERDATFRALGGLEPEQMTRVIQGTAGADTLQLVKKPRAEEHHKGGQVVSKGDAGDRCLTSWLSGAVDSAACASAAPAPAVP